MNKPIIYQMLPRLWGNDKLRPKKNGRLDENGTGKFSDIDRASLEYLAWLGCSHVWYTGIIRHSTQASTEGCIPSHPQFVKGKAGSPYAICDYYDVNPYLADNPDNRIDEFEQLIKRTHDAGLKVLIDFVPNHVSRDYGKNGIVPGHPVLGAEDDKSVHWKMENDFFYYPGEHLRLPADPPRKWKHYEEYPAMATGNDCFTPAPGINDWYETIKINYCDSYNPTWEKMYDIIEYWSSKGVDGFRCDMVELVPAQFFKWMIAKAKQKFPGLIFIAEVYKKELYRDYISNVGFDYLYDKSGLYDTLRAVVGRGLSAEAITWNWQFLGDLQPNMLNFLENHDEQRFGSDFFGRNAAETMAPLYVSLMLNTAPFMIYFGEEVGERGMDEEGFSGKDGRTTIFDWWSVASVRRLRKAIGSGAYKSLDRTTLVKSGMKVNEAEVFVRFATAVRFTAADNAVIEGKTFDLGYFNHSYDGFVKDRHFAFLRSCPGHTLLIVSNFSDKESRMRIFIPQQAFEFMGIRITDTLRPDLGIEVSVPARDGVIIQL